MNTNIRFEFKYIIGQRQARQIEAYIEKMGLKKDEFGSGRQTICSLYFDTPELKDYYDKRAGLKRRRKLRARIYGDDFEGGSGKIWLEIKNKRDMFVYKKRQPILPEAWLEFSDKGERFNACRLLKNQSDSREFPYYFLSGNYKPHAVVIYERRAFIGNFFAPFRLTLDSNIRACKWNDFRYNRNIIPVAKGKVILEVKFSSAMPWWFQDMVRRFNLERQAFSKYVNAVDAINQFNKISV